MNFRKQERLVTPQMQKKKVLVCGVGSTGSTVALTLAKMGFEDIVIVDGDKVEEHNIPVQVYVPVVGIPKVTAVRMAIQNLTGLSVTALDRMVSKENVRYLLRGVEHVFCCVDDVEARRWIAEEVGRIWSRKISDRPTLMDFRMGPEGGHALFCPGLSVEEFLATLDVEFYKGSVCGGEALYPNIAALVGASIVSWLAALREEVPFPRRRMWDFRYGFVQDLMPKGEVVAA